MNVTTRPLCLSPRRKAVLVALYRLARPTPWGLGYSPSLRQIAHASGYWSYSGAWWALGGLEKLGLVEHPAVAPLGMGVARAWRPNYDRLQYVTVSERLATAAQ